jgi:small nuclear ribonucleoprotein (snRNP)-like protein
VGTLKGFDQLMNVVLDDVKEVMRGESLSGRAYGAKSFVLMRGGLQMMKETNRRGLWDSSLRVERCWS